MCAVRSPLTRKRSMRLLARPWSLRRSLLFCSASAVAATVATAQPPRPPTASASDTVKLTDGRHLVGEVELIRQAAVLFRERSSGLLYELTPVEVREIRSRT